MAKSCLLIGLCAAMLAGPPARAGAAPDEPRKASIVPVLSQLRQEASRSWFADHTFPRSESDFAVERNLIVESDELVRVLSRRLHREPAVEAYIKWQLLSFKPDLAALAPEQVDDLLRYWPKLRVVGGPTHRPSDGLPDFPAVIGSGFAGIPAGFDPTISVVQGGDKLDTHAAVNPSDPRYVTMTTRASRSDIINIRSVPITAASNVQVIRFRDAMIDRLPRASGARLVARFRDVRSRLVAGDPSTPDAARALAEESDLIGREVHLSLSLREQLLAWTQLLGDISTPTIQFDPQGNLSRHTYSISKDVLDRINANLNHVASE